LRPGDSPPEEAKAPEQILQTATVAVESVETAEQVSQLPLPRRDPFRLAETLPGVQDNGRAASLYGQSPSVANITLDGVNVQNNLVSARTLNSISLALRTDQVNEAAIVTGAIYGCGCSQITFSTPSGRRALHGSAYWLTIPDGVTAQYWADNRLSTPATTSLNQLGAIFGGELKKNRFFFLLNYEAGLDRSTWTRTGDVPTHALISQDPLMQRVLDLIPASASGKYRGRQRNGSTGSLGLLRLDYLSSARNTFGLTVAGGAASMDDPSDSSVFAPRPNTTVDVSSRFFSAFWRWSVTARLTNEVRAGASLPTLDFRNSLRARFGFIAILNDPDVSVSQPMMGMDPQGRNDNLYSYQDNLNWVVGKHSLQFGAWVEQYRLNTYGSNRGLLDSLTVPRDVISNAAEGAIAEVDQRFSITSATSGY